MQVLAIKGCCAPIGRGAAVVVVVDGVGVVVVIVGGGV